MAPGHANVKHGNQRKIANMRQKQAAQLAFKQQKVVERQRLRQENVNEERLLRRKTRAQGVIALRQEQQQLREIQEMFRHLVPWEGVWEDLWLSVRLCAALISEHFCYLSAYCGVVVFVLFFLLSVLPVLISFVLWVIRTVVFYGTIVSVAFVGWDCVRATWNWVYYYEQRCRLQAAGEQSCCSVCLVDFGSEEEAERFGSRNQQRVLACGHCFHAECVNLWLARSHCCPLCRLPS
jgi:hypothetical protein